MLYSTNEQFEEAERNKTLKEFETEFNSFVYCDFDKMCAFIDVLSNCEWRFLDKTG